MEGDVGVDGAASGAVVTSVKLSSLVTGAAVGEGTSMGSSKSCADAGANKLAESTAAVRIVNGRFIIFKDLTSFSSDPFDWCPAWRALSGTQLWSD